MRFMYLHLLVLLVTAHDAIVLGQSTPSADAAADAANGLLNQPLPPFAPLPAPSPSEVLLDWSAPPQTNWWSLPQQQLCVADAQCGPGFYCHYVLSQLPTSYSSCRPCSLACMVCASATMQVGALDIAACASCACAYTPALDSSPLPFDPTDLGAGSGGRGSEGRTSDIPVRRMWAPCNTTSQCMDASLTYHVPSASAYVTTPPGILPPTLPYEAFYATRLFCSLSESTRRAAGSSQQQSADEGLGYCSSCLSDCSSDTVSAEGSCLRACGLPSLTTFPELGLPLTLNTTTTMRGLWPVVALLDAQALMFSALWAVYSATVTAASEDVPYQSPADMAEMSMPPELFGAMLSRAGMGIGRSVAAVQSVFNAMDLLPKDGLVTPLEWVYQRGRS